MMAGHPTATAGGGSGRPTLEEVAARAGVGRGTVSRVINGSPRVSDRTRAAVEAAVAELGYVPNRAARALAANRTDADRAGRPRARDPALRRAVLLRHHPRRRRRTRRHRDAAAAHPDPHDQASAQRFAQYLAAHRVDGVLLVSVHADDPLPDLLEQLGMPAVLSGRRSAAESRAVRRLRQRRRRRSPPSSTCIGRGRRTVATITGPLDMYVAQCRLDGYREALRGGGPRPDDELLVARGDFTEEGGRRAMRELLERGPDAGRGLRAPRT